MDSQAFTQPFPKAAACQWLCWAGPCRSQWVPGLGAGGSTEASGLKIPSYTSPRKELNAWEPSRCPSAISTPSSPDEGTSAPRQAMPRRCWRCRRGDAWRKPLPRGCSPLHRACRRQPKLPHTLPPRPAGAAPGSGAHGQLLLWLTPCPLPCLHLCPLETPSPLPAALWGRRAAGLAAALRAVVCR